MGTYKRKGRIGRNGKPEWYFQFNHAKQRYYGGTYGSQKEAKDAEQAKLTKLSSKRSRPIPRTKATFSEFLPRFVEHRRITRAARTVMVEACKAKQLERHFGKMRLSGLTTNDINEYVAEKKGRGAANRSVNLDLTLLRSIFKYAIESGFADHNPAREVTNLREIKTEKWIPSRESTSPSIFWEKGDREVGVSVPQPVIWHSAGDENVERSFVSVFFSDRSIYSIVRHCSIQGDLECGYQYRDNDGRQ